MRLAWLELNGFRSYTELQWQPDPDMNILVGDNGAGKTNVMEAIAYLGRLRSFRHAPDGALVMQGQSGAILRGEVIHESASRRIEIELPLQGRRRIQVDGKRPSRNSELRRHLSTVTFLPDDLDLVKGGAERRRGVLDDAAAQLRPTIEADQSDYAKALRQRNALLRHEGRQVDHVELESWEQKLAEAGSRVYLARQDVIEKSGPHLDAAYLHFAPGGPDVAWQYESRWAPPEGDEATVRDRLAKELEAARHRDIERRVTTVGPHRDDPRLFIADRDSRTMASQGEQRSLVLALRIATFDLLSEETGDPPVLLLDDVFSELDPTRAAAVSERLPQAQAFISTARAVDVPAGGTLWRVPEGLVSGVRETARE